jgi:cytochrome c biogenesis protein CcmG, thiol:disulfide interchange protein DsbE
METPDLVPTEPRRRRLPPGWLAVGAIALLSIVLLALALSGDPVLPPQVGQAVPSFQLGAFDGSTMDINAQRGKVVVLNFFASWCAPCRQEAADIEQTWRDYQAQGVQFFGIGYKDAATKARAFLDEFDVTYPATSEAGNHTARAYGVTGVPETFIIDRSGQLVRHVLGPITRQELTHELDQLVNP